MADLYINCPVKDQPVRTGVGMDEPDFGGVDIIGREVGCPACGQTHVWNKADAFFQG